MMETEQKDLLRSVGIRLILLIILLILAVLSLAVGSAGYSVEEIIGGLLGKGSPTVKNIVVHLRLPRVLIAAFVGACLATSGALLQAVMRNPLADPGIIGVSSGAGTAATTMLLIFPNASASLPPVAFLGAVASCILIYALAYDGGVSPLRIVLAGVAINTVLGGYNAMLQMIYSDSLSGVIAFMNGSLNGKTWSHFRIIVIYGTIGLILSFLCIRGANALQLGDEMANNLGFNAGRTRILLSALAAFLAAATVSVVGMIGFIGLIVPHISRMMVGSDYRKLLPTGMLLGAVVALGGDTVGRVLIPGLELPLGVVMAVLGGPFFLYMLRRKGKA